MSQNKKKKKKKNAVKLNEHIFFLNWRNSCLTLCACFNIKKMCFGVFEIPKVSQFPEDSPPWTSKRAFTWSIVGLTADPNACMSCPLPHQSIPLQKSHNQRNKVSTSRILVTHEQWSATNQSDSSVFWVHGFRDNVIANPNSKHIFQNDFIQ